MSTQSAQLSSHHTEDEHHKAELLKAMARELMKKMPEAKSFAEQLFARGAAEDISRYSSQDLVQLAEVSFKHLQKRKAQQVSIKIETLLPHNLTVIQVLNDNMPFLVDSVMGCINEAGHDVHFVVHPIFNVTRDKNGQLVTLHPDSKKSHEYQRESYIHIHTDPLDSAGIKKLQDELEATLTDVRLVVKDWRSMLSRLDQAVDQLKTLPPPIPVAEIAEAIQFLEWLRDNNFTFLGLREYKMVGTGAKGHLEPVDSTGLGLLKDPSVGLLRRGSEPVTMTPELREFLREQRPLIITKANMRSRVHRRIHIDYVGLKLFDNKGALQGELRFAGLFTSTAYTRSVRAIPFLRKKLENVLQRTGFDADSHSGKALVNIIEQYPRDELFQIDDQQLYEFSDRLLQLEERPRVRVLVRKDKFGRFVSALVYLPRDRYNSGTRIRIGEKLASAFSGRLAAWRADYPEGPLARLNFIIARVEHIKEDPTRTALEQMVESIVRTWEDSFAQLLSKTYSITEAKTFRKKYGFAFPPAYQDQYDPAVALHDLKILEKISTTSRLAINFYTPEEAAPHELGLKLFHRGTPLPLSQRVPILEAMGFSVIAETSVDISPNGNDDDLVVLHDMRIATTSGAAFDFKALDRELENAFLAVWHHQAENDGYNALVLLGGLSWRDVACLRALSRYLRQARIPYSQDYMWATLCKHAMITKDLVALFKNRFDPALKLNIDARNKKQNDLVAKIESQLEQVASLDEDRILRRFLNLILSTLRTNFFQQASEGHPKPVISFKLDSSKIEALPEPKPMVEIFVYSPQVEGVHLRFGRIARGGIRWSDRPQDFRTEVLGLVKAQQVKNAVIVPVGAKGGFVPKQLPPGPREAIQAEGVAAYKLFIASLLEITDNIAGNGKTILRDDLVRYDNDDPYLVVAADKGTATFSDIANELSDEFDHWLGDAFASGGSVGYDHKKMGITARGAWEAVKRHFRELNLDIQSTSFTAVGVGDMSGDVFGNGMLLSKHTRLVAAFDHRDIFIDPEPDTASSFKERQRMFSLPRSSWQDYDKKLISKGGGIFSRSAKSIPLTPQMQALLGLKGKEATPQQVMQSILKAKVDLLWFGGIGTYIRASNETDDQVGDRANDALRITGTDIQARVVGEGANLGMTQLGRIEAANRGVRLNTDAIDNSAGVNSSDMEVNIKIALGAELRTKKLDMKERNKLLASMTDDVAALVLKNNVQQTLALSVSQLRGAEDLGFAERLMTTLENAGRLNRKVEYLPDTHEIEARQKRNEGLTRPELAVLLAYAKLALHDELLESPHLDDAYFNPLLETYFPQALVKRYPKALHSHKLKREIIATQLSNALINRGGATVIARIADQTGAATPDIAASYAVTADAFNLHALNAEIDSLDNKIDGATQLQLYLQVQDLLHDRIVWFLRHGHLQDGLQKTALRFGEGIQKIEAQLKKVLPPAELQRLEQREKALHKASVPSKLAARLASLPVLIDATDIVLVASQSKTDILKAAKAYYAAGDLFSLADIYAASKRMVVQNYYDRLALDRAVADLSGANRRMAVSAVAVGGFEPWLKSKGDVLERTRQSLREIALSPDLTVAKLTVAAGQLFDVTRL